MHGLKAPSLAQLEQYNVNVEGQPEVIYQPIYDFQVYPAAGFIELVFFQVPEGQAGKTFDDTNMSLIAALPVPINMAITDAQVWFFPAAVPGRTGDIATTGENWNDVEAVLSAGNLQLEIGSKEYLVDAPLMKFPPQGRLAGAAALADSTTPAAAAGSQIDYATGAGRIYDLVPLRLISQQNFTIRLRFSALVPTPSTNAGRIGVALGGFRYRLAQ
ncbi:hypothetical protein LCGC14_0639900 [marine sediment metagenome]|uniref:Uncharacterized protein n=1 Tax=marine sediment metagenome TaxID=412755 RepID=A0A0F9QZG4_9ZZZZ